MNISIVTGTLNRKKCVLRLLANTVESDSRLELVLIDGGSTDGTINLIKEKKHPRIKLIEIGHRSSYPHFMNLGIKNASYEYVCQWNDDVVLTNTWNDVFNEIDNSKMYVFNWTDALTDSNGKLIPKSDIWNLSYDKGRILMNYGIYHKDVFRKIGMYNQDFYFYYADADMSCRADQFGFIPKILPHIKVLSDSTISKSNLYSDSINDVSKYDKYSLMYKERILPNTLDYL